MRYLIFALLLTGCTNVRIYQGDNSGDIWLDAPYKARSSIVDEQGPGDVDSDTSGDTEGASAEGIPLK